MTTRMTITLTALVALAVPAAAQPRPGQNAQTAQTAPAPPAAVTPNRQPTVTENVRRNAGQPFNIRLEVAITEEGGPKPITKTMSLIVAEGSQSFLRMSPTYGGEPMSLDGYAAFERDGKIRAMMTVDYRPPRTVGGKEIRETENATQSIRQSFTVLAENGRKMLISETADPFLDRRFRIELTATVLK